MGDSSSSSALGWALCWICSYQIKGADLRLPGPAGGRAGRDKPGGEPRGAGGSGSSPWLRGAGVATGADWLRGVSAEPCSRGKTNPAACTAWEQRSLALLRVYFLNFFYFHILASHPCVHISQPVIFLGVRFRELTLSFCCLFVSFFFFIIFPFSFPLRFPFPLW